MAAAGDLFTSRGVASVSVREIADRAGVNHGLVHHYFRSKQGLVDATLEDLATQAAKAVEEGADLDPGGPLGRYVLVAGRVLLDADEGSGDLSAVAADVVSRLAQLGGLPPGRGRVQALRAARLAATVMGWLLFEPALVEASDLGEEHIEWVRAELLRGAVG